MFDKNLILKTIKKLSLSFFILLSISIQIFADATITDRKNCWRPARFKYKATAKVSAIYTNTYPSGVVWPTGQYVGTWPQPKVSEKCFQENKGCDKQSASCSSQGIVTNNICNPFCSASTYSPYFGETKAYWVGTIQTLYEYATGVGIAGVSDEFPLDSSIFANLNRDGYTYGSVCGKIELNNNHLTIQNLIGELKIKKRADYFSKFKVLILKEDTSISEEQFLLNEELQSNGVYKNVVDSAEIIITNEELKLNGFFVGRIELTATDLLSDNGFGVLIKNLNFEHFVTAELLENEVLTLVTIIDGGFDISKAIPPNQPRLAQKDVLKNINDLNISLFPNPSSSTISVKLNALSELNEVYIGVYNILGQEIQCIFNDSTENKSLDVNNVDVSNLQKGTYFIKIKVNDNSQVRKLLIN